MAQGQGEFDVQAMFQELEERNGTRFSWNVWPANRVEAQKIVIPVGCMYTPLRKLALEPRPYSPVPCGACQAVLNPFCSVDYVGKLWVCPFCYQRNHFPANFAEVSEVNRPAELYPEYTTVEYVVPEAAASPPPTYLFCVDTCLDEKQFAAVKDSIMLAISMISEDSLIGLITFGSNVQLYELGFPHCPKSFVFRGSGPGVDKKDLQNVLSGGGISATATAGAGAAASTTRPIPAGRFLRPLQQVEGVLETILEELQRDPRPVKSDKRPLRATGVALSVAVHLLGSTGRGSSRVMLFTGGPCTHGAGMLVGEELREADRTWSDIFKGSAKYVSAATTFYSSLALAAVEGGLAVDVFGCAMHDVGLLEMRALVRATGGQLVTADKFYNDRFKTSFQKMFARDSAGQPTMAFDGVLSVQTSKDVKVLGAIGNCASLKRASPSVATDREAIGLGETSAWKFNALDPNTSVALYFDVVNHPSSAVGSSSTMMGPGGGAMASSASPSSGTSGMIQLSTLYRRAQGPRILRVTTVCSSFADPQQGKFPLVYGFDQEAALALMARWAVFRSEKESSIDILRWLDRSLIRLCSYFGDYAKNDPASFRLHPHMALFPQFMFHLRRSSILQVFGFSPDETTYVRMVLNRETVTNDLTMIQPTLTSYSFDRGCEPALLSARAIAPDRILLLDTFFSVVVFRGERIAQWVEQGFEKDPQYEHLRTLLAWPKNDADAIVAARFPTPRLVECDQHGSQARFLLAVVDPSVTHTSVPGSAPPGGEVIFSEDVSLEVFMEHLKKLSVAPQ